MPLPDFFDTTPEVHKESLEDQFARERKEWQEKIDNISRRLKNVMDIPSIMVDVYSHRQMCVEYHHYLISKLIALNREYKKQYSERLDFWLFRSQIRYSSDGARNVKIETELSELVEKRAHLDNHAKFIDKTVSTWDNIIYAIPRRVEVEQIARGK